MREKSNDCRFKIPSDCIIGGAHRQLEAVHIAWHQLLASEDDVDIFTANLNGIFQALRNVTFRLQALKDEYEDFAWYEEWRETAKGDKLLKWLVEARNYTVKVSDLKTLSSLKATVHGRWGNRSVFHLEIPPGLSDSEIVANVKAKLPMNSDSPATILLEHRWIVPDFPLKDVHEIIQHGVVELRKLISLAHEKKKPASSCLPGLKENLPCHGARLSRSIAMHKGELLSVSARRLPPPKEDDLRAAAERYGFKDVPKDVFENPRTLFEHAKKLLIHDGEHVSVAFVESAGGVEHVLMQAADKTEQLLMFDQLTKQVKASGADKVVLISEIWLHGVGENRGLKKEGLQLVFLQRGKPGLVLFSTYERKGKIIEFEAEIHEEKRIPAVLRSIQDYWAQIGSSQEMREDVDLKSPTFRSTAIGAYCEAQMVPAIKNEKPTLDEMVRYSVTRNIPASMHYGTKFPISERKGIVDKFLERHSKILAPEFRKSLELLPFLDNDTIGLWFEPRVLLLTELLKSQSSVADACRRLWDSLLSLHEKIQADYLTDTRDSELCLKELGLLRLIEGFMMEFLGAASYHYGERSSGIITGAKLGDGLIQIPLEKSSMNLSENDRHFPHSFFEHSVPLLRLIVMYGEHAIRFTFSDGSKLNVNSLFSGPFTIGENQNVLLDVDFQLGASADFGKLTQGHEYLLKINACGISKISIIRDSSDEAAIQALLIKIVYEDNSRELAMLAKQLDHKCSEKDCRAKKTGNVHVDFWSNKTVAATDPSHNREAGINLAHIMSIVCAFARDITRAPQTISIVRKTKGRTVFRHVGAAYNPAGISTEEAKDISPDSSYLRRLLN